MRINNKGYAITIIVFGILIVFVTVLSTLLITMNNSVKLNKTVKEEVIESVQLSSNTSGMSLTERIETLENIVSNIKKEIYPVGSIYMSAEDDTVEKVQERFGGTWEVYAQGRTLVGVGTTTDGNGNVLTYNSSQTGGSSLTQLSISNLPSHNHTYLKSNNATDSTILNIFQIPNHNHLLNSYGGNIGYYDGTGDSSASNHRFTVGWGIQSSRTDITIATGYVGGGEGHTHGITLSNANSETTGSNSSFSVQDPYITVYMYKRIG